MELFNLCQNEASGMNTLIRIRGLIQARFFLVLPIMIRSSKKLKQSFYLIWVCFKIRMSHIKGFYDDLALKFSLRFLRIIIIQISEFLYFKHMSTRFQTFTPSYQNISNRLNRLRHSSTSHSTPSIISTPKSIQKSINLYATDIPTQPKRRVSPNAILLTEDKFVESGKSTGRVTKNVGLKKYNQRQLKEVMQCKTSAPLRPQGIQNYQFKHQATPKQSIMARENSKMLRWQKVDQIKITQQQSQSPKSLYLEKQLIPGKLYKRTYLTTLLRK